MEEKLISDTTMMFMACACYALNKRNRFGKKRLMQFIADIQQVNEENEYSELREILNEKFKIDLPEVSDE